MRKQMTGSGRSSSLAGGWWRGRQSAAASSAGGHVWAAGFAPAAWKRWKTRLLSTLEGGHQPSPGPTMCCLEPILKMSPVFLLLLGLAQACIPREGNGPRASWAGFGQARGLTDAPCPGLGVGFPLPLEEVAGWASPRLLAQPWRRARRCLRPGPY